MPDESDSRSALPALIGLLVVALFALFSAGAPVQASHGVIFIGLGLLMLLFPGSARLPWWLPALGLLAVVLAALCFLPVQWFGLPEWRIKLEALGVATGALVTAHPQASAENLSGFAVFLAGALFVLTHRVGERTQHTLALLTCLGIAGYAVVSMLTQSLGWQFAWDWVPSFGFFPNCNHSATVLAIGAVLACGVLLQGIRWKRGGVSALAALTLAVCLWAALGYNSSRAGVLLILAGFSVWFLALGTRYVSLRLLLGVGGFVAVGAVVYAVSDFKVKARLSDFAERVAQNPPADPLADATASQEPLGENVAADTRLLIYKDALEMIGSEPWPGTGIGAFRYVFPQYRRNFVSSGLCVHPESDWLLLAAEAGPASALLLASAVIGSLTLAWRGARRHSGWPFRLACIVAAAIVPVHGLLDVPGHRVGIAWLGALCLALALRRTSGNATAGRWSRLGWRSAGALILAAGCWLAAAEWFGGPPLASVKPDLLAAQARTLQLEDAAEQKKILSGELPTPKVDQAEGDRLEAAISLLDEAVRLRPLDPELHYLRGALALFFTDKEDISRQEFAVHRLLEPRWVEVPLRQSLGWLAINRQETVMLWQDSMRRAEFMEEHHGEPLPVHAMERILQQAGQSDELMEAALDIARSRPEFVRQWAAAAPLPLLVKEMPGVLRETAQGAPREELLRVWKRRDMAAATAFESAGKD